MTNNQRVVKQYATNNLVAASIIASNPALYPPGGLMQEWADRILTQAAETPDAECGPLFRQVAA